MEALEKDDEKGSGKKIDGFMKDALECESNENIKDVITYLKHDIHGCLPMTFYFFCNGSMKKSHYCLHPCDDNNIIDKRYGKMICGKAMCLDCCTS